MTIKTKYNIGDEVWTLDFFDEPYKGEITAINTFTIYACQQCVCISYYIYRIGNRTETEVFPTKEELLKSL